MVRATLLVLVTTRLNVNVPPGTGRLAGAAVFVMAIVGSGVTATCLSGSAQAVAAEGCWRHRCRWPPTGTCRGRWA